MIISPLQEINSEKELLALLLLNSETETSLGLRSEDFSLDVHRRIFEAIDALKNLGVTVDPTAVLNYMKEYSLIRNEQSDEEYLFQLVSGSFPVQNLQYYRNRLLRLSERRKYSSVLRDAQGLLETEPGENESVFSRIEDRLLEISRKEASRGIRSLKDLSSELIDYISKIIENKNPISGLRTHFTQLDNVTTGLKPYELIVIAARPGVGKTTFALNIALNVALKEKKPVVIFSLEMSWLELVTKLICNLAMIPAHLLKAGDLTSTHKASLMKAITELAQSPIYIDDSGYLTIQDFNARVRHLRTTENLGLILVDYLQLMDDPKNQQGGRQVIVAAISRSLKLMAKEASCPVIAISQLNRSSEQRVKTDGRPQLSDLRESGAIEQDADIVAFIHREELVKPEDQVTKKGIAEIIIAKNRSGQAPYNFELLFDPKTSRFNNMPESAN